MRKYGESKTTQIMMATVPHVTSGLGLRKFQADGFLMTRVYHCFEEMTAFVLYRVSVSEKSLHAYATNNKTASFLVF